MSNKDPNPSRADIVLDSPAKIQLFRLLALRGALFLETKGMARKGMSAYASVKAEFDFKGNKLKVLNQFENFLEDTYGPLGKRYTVR